MTKIVIPADTEVARLRELLSGAVETLKDAERLKRAEALVADCAEYLKDGETPRQRMDRDHADVLALMEMLAKDRTERDRLRAEKRRALSALADAIEAARKEHRQHFPAPEYKAANIALGGLRNVLAEVMPETRGIGNEEAVRTIRAALSGPAPGEGE
jgi:hypothetical protein